MSIEEIIQHYDLRQARESSLTRPEESEKDRKGVRAKKGQKRQKRGQSQVLTHISDWVYSLARWLDRCASSIRGQSIMCLAAGTGAKQSSELRLIGNYFWICWTRPAGGVGRGCGVGRGLGVTPGLGVGVADGVGVGVSV